jgi:tetratricopeptide (TPR) repeat protein
LSDVKLSIDELTDRAEALEEGGLLDEALQAWRKALRYYATPYLHYKFGSLALDRGEASEGTEALLAAIELARDFPAPYVRLGILNIEQGQYERARTFLEKALELEERAATHTLLGIAQRSLGLSSAAIASLRRAINLDPAYDEAYYNLGVMLAAERPEEAREHLETALRLDPEYQEAHRELGWVLRRLERYDEAAIHLGKAIDLDGSDEWAYVYLGNLQWTRNDLDAAEKTFKKAIEVSPKASMTHCCLAMFYQYNNRAQEAEFFFDAAARLDSEDAETNFRFGMFLKELKENDKARVHLERALQFDPENQETRAALAELDS